MSEFVNYRKRGIQLPPGCKDLIDVLRRTAAVSEQPVVTRGSEILGKLSDVPRYVSMLVNSRSKQSTLLISTTDERLTLMLCRSVIEGISAGVMLTGDSKHEKGIREFFRRHGIEALQDELFPGELRGRPCFAAGFSLPQRSSWRGCRITAAHGLYITTPSTISLETPAADGLRTWLRWPTSSGRFLFSLSVLLWGWSWRWLCRVADRCPNAPCQSRHLTLMNRDAVLFHLREAKEELDRTIAQIVNEPTYAFDAFQVAMSHLYHHVNTAWNGRDASAERHRECAQTDFDGWRKFPPDADLLLDD